MKVTPYIIERIMDKVHIEEDTCCWIWCGGISKGSPVLYMNGRTIRVVYFIGLWFFNKGARNTKHTCGNKLCVNPDHLEIMTFTMDYGPSHNVS